MPALLLGGVKKATKGGGEGGGKKKKKKKAQTGLSCMCIIIIGNFSLFNSQYMCFMSVLPEIVKKNFFSFYST